MVSFIQPSLHLKFTDFTLFNFLVAELLVETLYLFSLNPFKPILSRFPVAADGDYDLVAYKLVVRSVCWYGGPFV